MGLIFLSVKKIILNYKIIYPVYLSDQSFDDVLDHYVLIIFYHYVLIKDFNRLTFSKTKNKNKKWYCKS